MKIIDTTTYFEEDMVMDVRFNVLNEYVDKFIVCEANYSHSGKKKNINFDKNNFPKFKNKIIHLVLEDEPKNLEDESSGEPHIQRSNSVKRINYQRDYISNYLKDFDDEDFIMYSDNDEIPNLKDINFKKLKSKIILFKQKTFYYKLNLLHPLLNWFGTKCCKKKDLKNITWLRSIKNKKYNFLRLDVLFSELKYMNINIIDNGGWHFTNLKTPEDLLKKYLNDEMHSEFKLRNIGLDEIKRLMNKQVVGYNHFIDSTASNLEKHSTEFQLEKIDINFLPKYIVQNSSKFKDWILE